MNSSPAPILRSLRARRGWVLLATVIAAWIALKQLLGLALANPLGHALEHGLNAMLAILFAGLVCLVALALGALSVRLFQLGPEADAATLRRAVMAETLVWRLIGLTVFTFGIERILQVLLATLR